MKILYTSVSSEEGELLDTNLGGPMELFRWLKMNSGDEIGIRCRRNLWDFDFQTSEAFYYELQ